MTLLDETLKFRSVMWITVILIIINSKSTPQYLSLLEDSPFSNWLLALGLNEKAEGGEGH